MSSPLLRPLEADPLPELAASVGAWDALSERLRDRPFLQADGLVSELGEPLILRAPMVERCRELVERFDKFYQAVIQHYYEDPSPITRALFDVHPTLTQALEADRSTQMALPLSRFDCVLTAEGQLRVIEINPIGVTTAHLRSAAYLARVLRRAGFRGDADRIDELYDRFVDAFGRFFESQRGSPPRGATLGVIVLGKMHRGTRVTWRDAFVRAGWRFVAAPVEQLEVTAQGVTLRGVPVDLLWGDFVFYLGTQFTRVRQTRFASPIQAYDAAPDITARLLGDPRLLEHLRSRRVLFISPPKAYLANSKQVLSLIHREDWPAPAGQRAWWAAHVARTYGLLERERGELTPRRAIDEREAFVLKPCQYGGSHGVILGAECSKADWASQIERIWGDPEWVLQDYHRPMTDTHGETISVGLYNYGGRFGGMTVRTSPHGVVSARHSKFVALVGA
jgi:glutathionylspermidine synthase